MTISSLTEITRHPVLAATSAVLLSEGTRHLVLKETC